jgi:hypothetical protein
MRCGDGSIKAKLTIASRFSRTSSVLLVLKEDADLALSFDKTKILVKGISAADAHQMRNSLPESSEHRNPSTESSKTIISSARVPHRTSLPRAPQSPALSRVLCSWRLHISLGVPICTDAFIQHFVKDKCQVVMEDVEKLDNIQDGFIHYQLIRFCQATRLQYLNSHVLLANQNVLQTCYNNNTSTTRSPTPS